MVKKNDLQFCVIGLGAFGFSLAKNLAENGAFVLAIDRNRELVEAIQEYVPEAVCLDATDSVLLEQHGVTKADVVIVAIGELFEPVVIIAMDLLKAGVPKVIARAGSNTQEIILNRIGVHQVIHPEHDEGRRMAKSLLRTSVSDYFEISDYLGVYEVDAPKGLCGYKLEELQLRKRYEVNLLTIKRLKNSAKIKEKQSGNNNNNNELEYDVLGVVTGETKIKEYDRLILMGSQEAIDRLLATNE